MAGIHHLTTSFRANSENIHLSNRSRDFSPDAVDVLIQALEREGLKGWVRLGQEAHQTGGRRQGGHCRVAVLPQSGFCKIVTACEAVIGGDGWLQATRELSQRPAV